MDYRLQQRSFCFSVTLLFIIMEPRSRPKFPAVICCNGWLSRKLKKEGKNYTISGELRRLINLTIRGAGSRYLSKGLGVGKSALGMFKIYPSPLFMQFLIP